MFCRPNAELLVERGRRLVCFLGFWGGMKWEAAEPVRWRLGFWGFRVLGFRVVGEGEGKQHGWGLYSHLLHSLY
jgi:hypothetical protein